MMNKIVGLKEFRKNVADIEKKVQQGHSFVIVKRSKPIFRITPLTEDEQWEEVIDFTTIKKGGVKVEDLLSRL